MALEEFRFLESAYNDAFFNMGLDEAVLDSVAYGARPTLRLYAWEPKAVSIGYFQGLKDEVDEAACKAIGVDVVRRLTGGGAVYHADELTYSIIVPEKHPLAGKSILESYKNLSAGLIKGLEELGINAFFAPLNDICWQDKKISGNAQTRRKGCILQHGTLLLSVNAEEMFSLLKVPNEKLKDKVIESVKARVGSVSDILGRGISYKEAALAAETGFRAVLGSLGKKEEATGLELENAKKSAVNRFQNTEWTKRR